VDTKACFCIHPIDFGGIYVYNGFCRKNQHYLGIFDTRTGRFFDIPEGGLPFDGGLHGRISVGKKVSFFTHPIAFRQDFLKDSP
jgi:hypothetical protein